MTVVGITGHRHIPASARPRILTGIAAVLAGMGKPLTGVSSLAAGADQLFAQAMLEAGGRLHVVVPCQRYVVTLEHSERVRYDALLSEACVVEVLHQRDPSDRAYVEAGHRVVELSEV